MDGIDGLEEIENFLTQFHFAVLHHILPTESNRPSHWDILLEPPILESESLLTFEVSKPPEKWGRHEIVRQLPAHRRLYLNYQGTISDGRGDVQNIASGTIHWLEWSDHRLVLELCGTHASGRPFSGLLKMERCDDKDGTASNSWQLYFQP
jgi:hypothetical protein